MIKPFTEFKIKNKLCYSHSEIYTDILNQKSILVVDLNNNTDYANINAIPVLQLFYNTIEEEYILKNNFIILGGIEDIC